MLLPRQKSFTGVCMVTSSQGTKIVYLKCYKFFTVIHLKVKHWTFRHRNNKKLVLKLVLRTLSSIWWSSKQLTLYVSIPQNGQTHPNNSSAFGDELFECVWPFCRISASQKSIIIIIGTISLYKVMFEFSKFSLKAGGLKFFP